MHQGGQDLNVRTIENRAKGHNSSLTVAPIGVLDVGLDEGHDRRDNWVTNALSKERKTGGGSHRHIPLVIFLVLLLLGQQPQQNGQDIGHGLFGKVMQVALWGLASL